MDKRYTKIEKQTDNKFLNMYHMNALTKNGEAFDYYFASRNDINDIKPVSHSGKPEGVAIFALYEDKVVLIKQYRYPIGDYIYELPAGLIDKGETPVEAAVREMKEETGLDFYPDKENMGFSVTPFYMCQGITDESSVIICGKATGNISIKLLEEYEDINVILLKRENIKVMLGTKKFSMRAALILNLFSSDIF